MGDYTRTTRACTLDSMRPELAAAMRAHVDKYNLGGILSSPVMCIETISVKAKKGLFGKAQTIYTGAILTSGWLVWASGEEGNPIGVLSARLGQFTAQDYAQSSFAKMIPDSGLNITGLFTDSSASALAFIGLEENAAGKKFKEAILAAAQRD
ncbi:MAG: hypothetical protein HFACDABA_02124 [Anaerolineales bacterium]|nr:hypothetical protein [Anaerolineales bacterium]